MHLPTTVLAPALCPNFDAPLPTATADDANDSIKAIREQIVQEFGTDDVTILYGGSVKPSNAKELFEMSDIDGGLVGGASLKVDLFSQIVNFDK